MLLLVVVYLDHDVLGVSVVVVVPVPGPVVPVPVVVAAVVVCTGLAMCTPITSLAVFASHGTISYQSMAGDIHNVAMTVKPKRRAPCILLKIIHAVLNPSICDS